MHSQNENILAYLKAGNVLTGLDALRLFGSMKLATRLSEIKRDNPGLDIRDEFVKLENGKMIKRYWIYRPKLEPDMFMSADASLHHEWAKK